MTLEVLNLCGLFAYICVHKFNDRHNNKAADNNGSKSGYSGWTSGQFTPKRISVGQYLVGHRTRPTDNRQSCQSTPFFPVHLTLQIKPFTVSHITKEKENLPNDNNYNPYPLSNSTDLCSCTSCIKVVVVV